jgi:hypothetical protein
MKITFDTGTSGVGALGGSTQALGLDSGLGSIGGGQGTDNMIMQLLMLLMMNMVQSNQNGQNGQQPAQAGALPLDIGGLGGSQLNADSSNPMNAITGLLQQVGKLLEALAPLLQNSGNNMGNLLATNLGQALEGVTGTSGTAGN